MRQPPIPARRLTVLIIGIGTGDPAQLTGEAVAAMNAVEVFLVADKGGAKRELSALRTRLCETVIDGHDYAVLEVTDPERDRAHPDYGSAVLDWHSARAAAYATTIERYAEESGMPAGQPLTVGFLVWGDPAFYDSTIRVAEALQPVELTVLPGISSIQLLAARHRIVLNRIGSPVLITTGRRLLTDFTGGDTVVMLDGGLACTDLVADHPDLLIYWGAQLGLPAERLISGRLADVLPEISVVRAELRKHHGWVMDTYVLRPGG